MGGPAYDCLTNPLGAVRFSFVNALSSGYDPASSVGKDWGVVDLFRHYFSDESAISQVYPKTLTLPSCVLGLNSVLSIFSRKRLDFSCNLVLFLTKSAYFRF